MRQVCVPAGAWWVVGSSHVAQGGTWEGGRGDLLCDVGDATLWKMRNSRLKEEKAAVI